MSRNQVVVLGHESLHPGDSWESPARTITESDVVNFAGLSGDYNPLHVDHEYAKSTPFQRPIAHGLLGLSIVSGLVGGAPRVATEAFTSILEWKFLRPIHFGDTLRVVSEVESVEVRAKGRRALVTWRRRLCNQKGEVVQEGRTETLVRSERGTASDTKAEPSS